MNEAEYIDLLFTKQLQEHVRDYTDSRAALAEVKSRLTYMRKRLELTAQMLALDGIRVELPPMHPTREPR